MGVNQSSPEQQGHIETARPGSSDHYYPSTFPETESTKDYSIDMGSNKDDRSGFTPVNKQLKWARDPNTDEDEDSDEPFVVRERWTKALLESFRICKGLHKTPKSLPAYFFFSKTKPTSPASECWSCRQLRLAKSAYSTTKQMPEHAKIFAKTIDWRDHLIKLCKEHNVDFRKVTERLDDANVDRLTRNIIRDQEEAAFELSSRERHDQAESEYTPTNKRSRLDNDDGPAFKSPKRAKATEGADQQLPPFSVVIDKSPRGKSSQNITNDAPKKAAFPTMSDQTARALSTNNAETNSFTIPAVEDVPPTSSAAHAVSSSQETAAPIPGVDAMQSQVLEIFAKVAENTGVAKDLTKEELDGLCNTYVLHVTELIKCFVEDALQLQREKLEWQNSEAELKRELEKAQKRVEEAVSDLESLHAIQKQQEASPRSLKRSALQYGGHSVQPGAP